MALNLIAPVEAMTINLTRDTDWIRVLEADPAGSISATADVEIRWYAGASIVGTWPATVTVDDASWNVDKAVVNALIALNPTGAKLFYVDGSLDLLWAMATAVVVDG
jgi:hypothetical protein